MGLDFWAVKRKKGLSEEDKREKSHWDLIEDVSFYDFMDEDLRKFISNKNDKVWAWFCKETVGTFVNGDPIYDDSEKDINELADKLNEFIQNNPNYEYKYDEYDTYSNEDVKKFIKYINLVRDNGFILWISI